MTTLLFTSSHDRHWDAQVALRRPDLVVEESDRLERMAQRYWELSSTEYGPIGATPTDRIRVLRHLINEATQEPAADADPVKRRSASWPSSSARGDWTAAQAARLAALIDTHPGAQPLDRPGGRRHPAGGLRSPPPRRRVRHRPAGRAAWTELAASSREPLAA